MFNIEVDDIIKENFFIVEDYPNHLIQQVCLRKPAKYVTNMCFI